MQLTALLLTTTTLLSTAALAAPTSMAAADEWTIQSLSRACAEDDSSCLWQFGVSTGANDTTPIAYTVNATDSAPASRAVGVPAAFGRFTVASTWSGQFGEDGGFTTFSVIDYEKKLIVYPAYKDTQVATGEVVTPDQSYPVQNLP